MARVAREHVGADDSLVYRWEHGQVRPTRRYRRVLAMLCEAQLDIMDHESRREFLSRLIALSGGFLSFSILPARGTDAVIGVEDPAPGSNRQRSALLRHRWLQESQGSREIPELPQLRRSMAAAKQGYQACRYAEVGAILPKLFADLDLAAKVFEGDQRRAVEAIAAEAYHVEASIQLKFGNEGPAWMAADASICAAERSEDPVIIGCSARIVTHALMDGRHLAEAKQVARRMAGRLAASWSRPDAEALSVYGSLLLRGSVAAARGGDRSGAEALLDEAAGAGRRIGGDHNYRWTAFGPTNVLVHRVHVAVLVGDAGTAIEQGTKIDVPAIPVAERRVSLLVDMARAYVLWGKHRHAYETLRTAEDLAPEELTARPAVRSLIRDVATGAPSGVRQRAGEWAARFGVSV